MQPFGVGSIHPLKLDPRVVLLKNRRVRVAFFCETKRAGLAQSDPVTPAAADEHKRSYFSSRVFFGVDHKQVFSQAERADYLSAPQLRTAFIAGDFDFGDTV